MNNKNTYYTSCLWSNLPEDINRLITNGFQILSLRRYDPDNDSNDLPETRGRIEIKFSVKKSIGSVRTEQINRNAGKIIKLEGKVNNIEDMWTKMKNHWQENKPLGKKGDLFDDRL